jgi:hypothetical protein
MKRYGKRPKRSGYTNIAQTDLEYLYQNSRFGQVMNSNMGMALISGLFVFLLYLLFTPMAHYASL